MKTMRILTRYTLAALVGVGLFFGLFYPLATQAQNAKSNAVWVGVSVNTTNGTVSPQILEQRIAIGSGIDTNAFVPKWPAWYYIDGHSGPYSSDISGLGNRNVGPFGFMVLQSYSTNNGGFAYLSIQATGSSNSYLGTRPQLRLIADGPMHSSARDHTVRANESGYGLVFTNSVDNVFPVTWNGVTKTGWDEIGMNWPVVTNVYGITNYSIPKGLEISASASVPYPYFVTNLYGLVRSYGSGGGYLTLASEGGVCLASPWGYFALLAPQNGNCFEASVPLKAPALRLGDTTNRLESVNGELTWGGQPIGGGGGLSGSRVITTNSSVAADDYLVWLDTRAFSASDSVTLTLPDMDADSQTIVVRRLGNTGAATIARGTNTWTLGYDGDGVTVDWLGAATNWFWRTF